MDEPQQRPSWVWVAAAVLGIGAVLAIALFRTVGPLQSDATEQFKRSSLVNLLPDGGPVQQSVIATDDGLSQVSAWFGTYGGGSTDCALEVTVEAPDGDTLSQRDLPCADIPDTRQVEVARFDPQGDSKGRTYVVHIARKPGGEHAVSVWAGRPIPQLPGSELDPGAAALALELRTGYGNDRAAAGTMSTALRRIARVGPPWAAPAVVVGLAFAVVALLVALLVFPWRRAVTLLVVLAVLKGVLWSVVMPPLEGPDEVAHYGYSQYLAEQHRIPRRAEAGERFDYSDELDTAVRELHVFADIFGDRPDYTGPRPIKAERVLEGPLSRRSNGHGAAAGYAPVFYAPAALLYEAGSAPLTDRLGLMRLWSVALGGLAVWLTVLAGRRMFASASAALALGAALALQPMFSQQTAVLNNDAGAIAAGAGCLLVALQLASRDRPRQAPLVAGLVLGAGVLAKPYLVVFGPVMVLAWIVGRLRASAPRPQPIRDVVAAGVGVVATYGVWTAIATLFDYPSLGLVGPDEPGERGLGDLVRFVKDDHFASVRKLAVDHLWGDFSWNDLQLPLWARETITVALAMGLLVIGVALARSAFRLVRRRAEPVLRPIAEATDEQVAWMLCAATVGAQVVLMAVLAWISFEHTGSFTLVVGRYALPVLPAIFALPVLALRTLHRRISPTFALVLMAATMFVFNVTALGQLVDRFYL